MDTSTSPHAVGRQEERGTVLVLSVIVITLIMVIITDASHIARVEWEATSNADLDLRLEFATRAGYQIAEAYLRQDLVDSPEADHPYEEWCPPGGHTVQLDPRKYGLYDGGGDQEEEGEDSLPQVRIIIEDEDRKWPLPLLRMGNETEKEQRVQQLARLLDWYRDGTRYDLDPSRATQVARHIADFVNRDFNDQSFNPTPKPPTKSGLPLSVTDLALIPQISPDLLFDVVDPGSDFGNKPIAPGLMHFLTLWTDLKSNVNTAPEAVLRAMVKPEDFRVGSDIFRLREEQSGTTTEGLPLDPTERSRVLRERREAEREREEGRAGEGENPEEEQGAGFWTSLDELNQAGINTLTQQVYDDLRPFASTTSNVFSIWVEVELLGVRKTRRYVVRRGEDRFILILSEQVDYPRYREPSEAEMQQENSYYDDTYGGR